MNFLFDNISTILGFGFLGLSFLFVYLAYKNVNTIVNQPSPNPQAVSLSKFFMVTALVFMICAGPLQLAYIWGQNALTNKEVTVFVGMAHQDWDETYGKIMLLEDGRHIPITDGRHQGTLKHEGQILLDATDVAEFIRTIQAQLVGLNSRISVETELGREQLAVGG